MMQEDVYAIKRFYLIQSVLVLRSWIHTGTFFDVKLNQSGNKDRSSRFTCCSHKMTRISYVEVWRCESGNNCVLIVAKFMSLIEV